MGLMHKPKLLFLDEPTTGLDPQTRNAVWEHLRRMHREGTTIFLTTQYMEEADQLCERLCIIDHGKIVAEGTPEKLKGDIGADYVTIRLPQNENFAAEREKSVRALSKIEPIEQIQEAEDGVRFSSKNSVLALKEAMQALDKAKVSIKQLIVEQPTLDTVFLHHTGREMRVEEVKPVRRVQNRGRRGNN